MKFSLSVYVSAEWKDAITVCEEFVVRMQLPVPEQPPPLQPPNEKALSPTVAVRVTCVPDA
jgi:hypothetical protein